MHGTISAICGVKQIVGAISRRSNAVPRGIGAETAADFANDDTILRRRYAELSPIGGGPGIGQMVDMQQRIIRPDNGAGDIPHPQVGPCRAMTIYAAMSPADHDMRAEIFRIAKVLRPDKVAHVATGCTYWDDQANMHTIRFDENGYTGIAFSPSCVGGDETAQESGGHIQAQNK